MSREIIDLNRQTIGEYDLKLILKKHAASVEVLDLSETPITDLSVFLKLELPRLRELNISNNVIEDLAPIGRLKNLEILRANQVNIENLDFCASLTSLEELAVEYTNLKSLKGIENLTNLRRLALMGNYAIVDLSPLRELKKLNELFLEGTSIYCEDQLSAIAGMRFKKLMVNERLFSTAAFLFHVKSDTDRLKKEKIGAAMALQDADLSLSSCSKP